MKKISVFMFLIALCSYANENPTSKESKEKQENEEYETVRDPYADPNLSWGVKSSDGKRVFAYDLVKANLQENLAAPQAGEVKDKFLLPLQQKFAKLFSDETIRVIAYKLSKIDDLYTPLASHMLYGLQGELWRVSPEGSNEATRGKRVEVAHREDHTIYLQKENWDLMDATNQASLVIRNVLSASLKPENILDRYGNQKTIAYRLKMSSVEEGVAYLFSDDLESLGFRGIYTVAYYFFDFSSQYSLYKGSPLRSAPQSWITGFGTVTFRSTAQSHSRESATTTLYLGTISQFLQQNTEENAAKNLCDDIHNSLEYEDEKKDETVSIRIPLSVMNYEGVSFNDYHTDFFYPHIPQDAVRALTQLNVKTNTKLENKLYKQQLLTYSRKTAVSAKCHDAVMEDLRNLKKAIVEDLKYPAIYSL